MTRSTTPSRLFASAVRPGLAVLCVVLSIQVVRSVHAWQVNRDALVDRLAIAGVDDPTVIETVRREGTPHHARLATARALVFGLLSAAPIDATPEAERAVEAQRRRAQLDTASAFAADGLRAQSNSWQAAMLLGATTYLRWSMDRDPRLFTEAETWQEPLLTALNEAPAQDEPRRLLATAYLELWPALSREKKAFARDLLRQTFAEDPGTFARLGPTWMTIAASTEEAFSVVPSTPKAWKLLANGFAKQHQWHRFREAHARGLDALETSLEARLADGIKRLSLGDDFHSRTRFARVVADAPRTMRFAPLVNRALSHYPPGLQTAGTGTALRDWLAWSMRMETFWVTPLTPPNVARLATLAERLPPPEAALAALIGGDLALAERLERLELTVGLPEWAPYLLAKTRHFLDRNLHDDARQTLHRVAVVSRDGAVYHLLRQRLAQATEDENVARDAEIALRRFRAMAWSATAWRERSQAYQLTMLPETPLSGILIEVAEAPETGAVVEVSWDGAAVRTASVYPGDRVEVSVDGTADKPSLLVWRTVAGEPSRPGAVRPR